HHDVHVCAGLVALGRTKMTVRRPISVAASYVKLGEHDEGTALVSSGSPLEPEIGFSRAVRAGAHIFVAGTTSISASAAPYRLGRGGCSPVPRAGPHTSGSASRTKLPCVLSRVAGSGPRPSTNADSSILRPSSCAGRP